MGQDRFRCTNCGYIPREPPISGSWYCPKCGKQMKLPQYRPRVVKKHHKNPPHTQKSRDQVISQIYDQLTLEKNNDSNYKEPYLNPKIKTIQPKERDKIRFFFKKKS